MNWNLLITAGLAFAAMSLTSCESFHVSKDGTTVYYPTISDMERLEAQWGTLPKTGSGASTPKTEPAPPLAAPPAGAAPATFTPAAASTPATAASISTPATPISKPATPAPTTATPLPPPAAPGLAQPLLPKTPSPTEPLLR